MPCYLIPKILLYQNKPLLNGDDPNSSDKRELVPLAMLIESVAEKTAELVND